MDKEAIGRYIKSRRAELRINQQDLADLSGVNINTVVAVERATGNPTIDVLLKLLQTLGLELSLGIRKTY